MLYSRPRGCGFQPHRRHCVVVLIYPSLLLVQPRKTHPCFTARLLLGCKESYQTNKQTTTVLMISTVSHVISTANSASFTCVIKVNRYHLFFILNETSKPPLNIFSNILTYMIHTWLQFTLNMEKSIKLNLSKFHFHKLKLTCSIDRLYKGTIAFHFHTNAKI